MSYLLNSILWGNEADSDAEAPYVPVEADLDAQVYVDDDYYIDVNSCCIQDDSV